MAGTSHIDPEVEAKIIALNDEICSFERATTREYTLILVPHSSDEEMIITMNGKPVIMDVGMEPADILDIAMKARQGGEHGGS